MTVHDLIRCLETFGLEYIHQTALCVGKTVQMSGKIELFGDGPAANTLFW